MNDFYESSSIEHYSYLGEKTRLKGMMAKKVRELEVTGFSEEEIIEELTILAHESGFLLSNMISEDDQTSGRSLLEAVKDQFSIYEPRFYDLETERNGGNQRIRRRRSLPMSHAVSDYQNPMKCLGYSPWEAQDGAHDFVKGLSKYFILMDTPKSLQHPSLFANENKCFVFVRSTISTIDMGNHVLWRQ